jgi:hypothetical protein
MLPAGAAVSLGSMALRFAGTASRTAALAWAAIVFALWVIAFAILWRDPLGVVNWWFD